MPLTPQDLALIRRKASEVDAAGFYEFQRDNQNDLIIRMLNHIDGQAAEIVRLSGKTGFCADCVKLAGERDALKAIVDRMPTDEAGNPITDGQEMWALDRYGNLVKIDGSYCPRENIQRSLGMWKEAGLRPFATREAALAAKGGGN